jgi:hypothetical protein
MWQNLCEKNVKLFNDHPVAYALIGVSYTFVASYGYGRFIRKLAEDQSIKK